jgi:hypothetical protein
MSDMLESRLIRELRRHHLWFDRAAVLGHPRPILIVIIIHIFPLARKVRGSLVFVGSSILKKVTSAMFRRCARVGTYVVVSGQDLSNVGTRVLVQFLVISKDNNGDVDGAEDGQLMCLLEQTAFALEESSANGMISCCAASGKTPTPTLSGCDHP